MSKAYHLTLIYHEGAGFFSMVNKLMNYIQKYRPLASISWSVFTPEIYGTEEVFGQVFDSYTDPAYENHQIENIICHQYTNHSLTGETAKYLYREADCKLNECIQAMNWRQELNGYWNKYFKIHNEQILETFEEFKQMVNMKRADGKIIITFLARHLDHAKEQVDKKLPDFSSYDNEIQKITGGDLDKAFLICQTDSMEAFTYFSEKYKENDILFPPTERQWAHELQIGYSHGTSARIPVAMLSVLYLSTGDYFIHPISNMSTAVLYINPGIKNIYLGGI